MNATRSRTLLAQGWTDSLRTLYPKQPLYTFWDYKRHRWERDAGLRIDHLLVSEDLRVARAEILEISGSDHLPIVVDVGW